jgi:PAS domain S-box-containing protein
MDLIRVNEAHCRDCYKCLRSCPVKAIRMERAPFSQQFRARVEESRCVLDGRCIAECPQKAKTVHPAYPNVRKLITENDNVWVSLAPSYVAAFANLRPGQVLAGLRKLGFAGVRETAVGAEWVAAAHYKLAKEAQKPVITSSCPAVVNLIEMYIPEMLSNLAHIVSPMIAHARLLKKESPDRKVVFIGPCLAKYDEITRPGLTQDVDHVISFVELENWWAEAGIDPSQLEDECFDGPAPQEAVLFPLDGGLIKTAGITPDMLSNRTLTVSGLDNCREFLVNLAKNSAPVPMLVEMMACPGGCINGPLMPADSGDAFARRMRILKYREERPKYRETCAGGGLATGAGVGASAGAGAGAGAENKANSLTEAVRAEQADYEFLQREYENRQIIYPEPSEEQIKEVLAKTSKYAPEDELNCGACGYNSCKEKAKAVLQGMADPEMCIPYMRTKAESMANLVFFGTPNGVLVVDSDEKILDLNSAAERIFGVSRNHLVGTPVSELIIDSNDLRKVFDDNEEIVRLEKELPELGLTALITAVSAKKENVALLIVEDITGQRQREKDLQLVREVTLERAQEVIDKQMAVAQKIAGLLGETTAETKVILTKLMRVMKEEGNADGAVSGDRHRSAE